MIELIQFFYAIGQAAVHSAAAIWAIGGAGAALAIMGYSWTTKTDNVTQVAAAHVNLLQTEKLDRDGAVVMTGPLTGLYKDVYSSFTANTDLSGVSTACYGQYYNNIGAAGAIEIELPAALVGMSFTVRVSAAQTIKLDPNGTERIDILTGSAGDYLISDAVIGTFIQLKCEVAGHWVMWAVNGAWTEE